MMPPPMPKTAEIEAVMKAAAIKIKVSIYGLTLIENVMFLPNFDKCLYGFIQMISSMGSTHLNTNPSLAFWNDRE